MIPDVKEVAPHVAQVRELKPKYPFLRMVGTDAGSERGASVRFPVARIELKPDFLSNAKTLQDIEDAIRLVLDSPALERTVKELDLTLDSDLEELPQL